MLSIPPDLTGPLAALFLSLMGLGVLARVITLLWRDHLRADKDDRDERDRAIALLEASLVNNRAAIAAWDRKAAADAARHRKADA